MFKSGVRLFQQASAGSKQAAVCFKVADTYSFFDFFEKFWLSVKSAWVMLVF